jgi:SnoaL-like domain
MSAGCPDCEAGDRIRALVHAYAAAVSTNNPTAAANLFVEGAALYLPSLDPVVGPIDIAAAIDSLLSRLAPLVQVPLAIDVVVEGNTATATSYVLERFVVPNRGPMVQVSAYRDRFTGPDAWGIAERRLEPLFQI